MKKDDHENQHSILLPNFNGDCVKAICIRSKFTRPLTSSHIVLQSRTKQVENKLPCGQCWHQVFTSKDNVWNKKILIVCHESHSQWLKVNEYIHSSTVVFLSISIYSSTIQRKYCTFHSTTFIRKTLVCFLCRLILIIKK